MCPIDHHWLTARRSSARDPGGKFPHPKPSTRDLLDLRIYPRHNIYLSNDNIGGLVLDARISHVHGEQYCGMLGNAEVDVATNQRFNVVIFRGDTGQTLVERVDLPVNATGVEVQFR